MDTILNFINDNSTVIMSIVSVGGFSIATFLISKITKSTVNVVVNYIANIVAKLFGGDSSITLDGVNKLPFIDDLREYASEIKLNWELKLIDLKRKLLSPKLSKIERATFQNEYDKILDILKGKLSYETEQLLLELENLAKGE